MYNSDNWSLKPLFHFVFMVANSQRGSRKYDDVNISPVKIGFREIASLHNLFCTLSTKKPSNLSYILKHSIFSVQICIHIFAYM